MHYFYSHLLFCPRFRAVAILGIWEWTQFARLKQPLIRFFVTTFLGVFIFLWLYTEGNYLDAGRVFEQHLQLLLINAVSWWGLALLLVISYPKSAKFWSKNPLLQLLFAFSTLIPFIAGVLRLRLEHYTHDPYHGLFLLLYVFVLVWAADSGAYFSGRAFGKRKLAPKVSPGKSWEGVIGGLITALVLAFIFIHFSNNTLVGNRNITGFIILSVATVAISVLGDLTESMFKRESRVKDSSQLIPGHGGVLDRIDSLTAAVPFFSYFYFFVL